MPLPTLDAIYNVYGKDEENIPAHARFVVIWAP